MCRWVKPGALAALLLFAAASFGQSSWRSSWRPGQLLESRLLFHPVPHSKGWKTPPPGVNVQDVWLTSADGNRIHAWWRPVPGAKRTLLFCHGNAGNVSYWIANALPLQQRVQASALIFDYPGYGRSKGKPSESGCHAAANAAYDWLTKTAGVLPEDLVLLGVSLGGGVATELATHKPHQALILVSTFTSIPDIVQQSFLGSLSSSLVKNRFDNLSKIAKCPQPVFMAHGDQDQLVPLTQARKLYEAVAVPKHLYLMKGNGHNDAWPAGFYKSLEMFLDRTGQQ